MPLPARRHTAQVDWKHTAQVLMKCLTLPHDAHRLLVPFSWLGPINPPLRFCEVLTYSFFILLFIIYHESVAVGKTLERGRTIYPKRVSVAKTFRFLEQILEELRYGGKEDQNERRR